VVAPVVVGLPVAGELLDRRQLHALRPVVDELLAGQPRCVDAPAQLVQLLLRNVDLEGPDPGCGFGGRTHENLLSLVRAAATPSSRIRGPSRIESPRRHYSCLSRPEQRAD